MIVTMYSVFCDHDDCADWVAEASTKHAAFKAAAREGWLIRQRRPRHTCPRHRPDRLVGNLSIREVAS